MSVFDQTLQGWTPGEESTGMGTHQHHPPQYQQPQYQQQQQPQYQQPQQHYAPKQEDQQHQYHQHQYQQQQQYHQQDNSTMNHNNNSGAGVDGLGMWRAWAHSYNEPKYACLDLLDNCFDATLTSGFHGKVTMDYLLPNGLIITNNAAKPIKSLEVTLMAYRSEKTAVDSIGEYGVGLKHSCATLSNINFVLTRNKHEFDFGVIARDLQTKDSVSLPHFPFGIEPHLLANNNTPPEVIAQELRPQIEKILHDNPHVHALVTSTLGQGFPDDAAEQIVHYAMDMLTKDQWKQEDHVFQLIITDFLHASNARSANGMMYQPARNFLNEVRDLIQKYYINIPLHDFDFWIMGERMHFVYWQNRLVEMAKFEVNVPKDTKIKDLTDDNWMDQGYSLSIYCGFDALRFGNKHGEDKGLKLCFYSRQSGRLIEENKDARAVLGLPASGVDYTQGLTVIIDDVAGELPLKPAKDGLTWSKEHAGAIHESNLYAWAGAVARFYWDYHSRKFQGEGPVKHNDYKSRLNRAVVSFMEPIQNRIQQQAKMLKEGTPLPEDECSRIETAKFTELSDPNWYIKHVKNSERIEIRKKAHKVELWPQPATVFRFNETHYPPKIDNNSIIQNNNKVRGRGLPTSLKRKSSTAGAGAEEEEAPRPRGRPPKKTSTVSAGRRRSSAASQASSARRTSVTQPNSDDSSSGSEEEEVSTVVATPPAKKMRMIAVKKTPRNSIAPQRRIGMITPQHGDDSNDGARVKELEKELQSSQETVKRLEEQLKGATERLLEVHRADPSRTRAFNAERHLQTTMEENEKLKHDNKEMTSEIERLQTELQQRDSKIQELQRRNYEPHLGHGTDDI
ncbi:expressed unknown protein [Seminavis robusta]|uniref:Uncharacterized protein n=1 Tax=Seminavis robusta TaxID=568900 RepID=A0A9N8DAZ8_9STRA|nr:expressed unknown protein [Seminavis robusta]|eukprot:Sro19_g013660.1 n/a (847) ;mRNA; r:149262-151802